MTAGRTVTIPVSALGDEIAFAITYTAACNRGRDLLGADRQVFAEALAGMITERAENGLSGMTLCDGSETSVQGVT